MIIGTKLEGHKELTKDKILVFDKPKYVYIPLIIGSNKDITINVKEKDYVYKNQIIGYRNDDKFPIHASVSGKVINFEEKNCYNGQKVKCVVIENDMKEEVKEEIIKQDKIDNYTKEEFIDLLKSGGIRGLGGADFPTYIKYKSNKKIKHLIINGIECEPYITADYEVMKLHYEEILECIDAIMNINSINNGYIAIKKSNTEITQLLNTVIGTYPKIKIVQVPNLYPMGWEKNIVKYILKKDYDKLPIELDCVVNNVSTIYSIYNLLKYHQPLIDRIVTITGEMVKKPINVNVKIGTDIKDILDELGIKKGKKLLIAGGPMMGINIPNDELVVTSNLNNVLVIKEPKEDIAKTCLRCGKCANKCPALLSPVMIKDNLENKEMLKYLNANKCIECGLCSYICPAKINVREYIRKAKDELRRK